MGNFNYRGNWHRDYQGDLETIHDDSNLKNFLLVGIYNATEWIPNFEEGL